MSGTSASLELEFVTQSAAAGCHFAYRVITCFNEWYWSGRRGDEMRHDHPDYLREKRRLDSAIQYLTHRDFAVASFHPGEPGRFAINSATLDDRTVNISAEAPKHLVGENVCDQYFRSMLVGAVKRARLVLYHDQTDAFSVRFFDGSVVHQFFGYRGEGEQRFCRCSLDELFQEVGKR